MNELPLFRALQAEPERPPPDLPYIRKSLHWTLRLMRDAQILPWSESETARWEDFFPQLSAYLPSEEAEALNAQFRSEIVRLRAARW